VPDMKEFNMSNTAAATAAVENSANRSPICLSPWFEESQSIPKQYSSETNPRPVKAYSPRTSGLSGVIR